MFVVGQAAISVLVQLAIQLEQNCENRWIASCKSSLVVELSGAQ